MATMKLSTCSTDPEKIANEVVREELNYLADNLKQAYKDKVNHTVGLENAESNIKKYKEMLKEEETKLKKILL